MITSKTKLTYLMALGLLVSACSMPLPRSQLCEPGQECNTGSLPGTVENPSELSKGITSLVQAEDLRLRSGFYQGTKLSYLDFLLFKKEVTNGPEGPKLIERHRCGENPQCQNSFESLTVLNRYEFVFPNPDQPPGTPGTPVIGQLPIFGTPAKGESDGPFRRILKVIVPFGYQANSIQSEADLNASLFKRISTNTVVNNLSIYLPPENPQEQIKKFTQFTPPLEAKEAWYQGKKISFLELGELPFNQTQNQLGFGLIFFMRNKNSQTLPSQPLPIFDSIPGDLLYSPIRQVFRAESENQITRLVDDPSARIRSQETLLANVNQGVFKLKEKKEASHFLFPIVQTQKESPTTIYDMRILSTRFLPALGIPQHYALWTIDKADQPRLILRFQNPNGVIKTLQGETLSSSSFANSLFSFSQADLDNLQSFIVTIEGDQGSSSPSVTHILESQFQRTETIQLRLPFQTQYASLPPATLLLSNPSQVDTNTGKSGLWFVKKTTDNSGPPLSSELEPGIQLAPPPLGWVYNGWLLASLKEGRWLTTGAFKQTDQGDNNSLYQGPNPIYDFPGEDFIQGELEGISLPLNLSSSGEISIFLSLEPENIPLKRPFFELYRHNLTKGTPAYKNLSMTQQTFFTPEMTLNLSLRQ